MFRDDEVSIEIILAEKRTLIVEISTPVTTIRIVGDVEVSARSLHVTGAHIEGAKPGTLGRLGLNAVGRRLLEEADVDEIIIEGGARTTGRMAGRTPRAIRFPHA